MIEVNKIRKKRLIYINIFMISILCLAAFGQFYFSATKLFAKTPLSLTLVEESVKENQAFHLDISDERDMEELGQLTEPEIPTPIANEETNSTKNETSNIKRELTLSIPEGVTFNEAAEIALLQEDKELEELPVFNWNQTERTLAISMSPSQTSLRVVLTAEDSGDYTFKLSNKINDIIPEVLKISVERSESDYEIEKNSVTNATSRSTEGSTFGSEAAATNIIEVGTWEELNNAVINGFTGADAHKNNADYIKITADIENPGNLGTGDTRRNAPSSRVDYVIDGQGHTVDFNQVRFTWAASTSIDRNIYIKDIKMYGQSAYGPFAIGDTSTITSTISYENVYYRGSQLSASWQATMIFKGINEFYSVNSYEAPLRPGIIKNTWANQSGLEAFRAIYEENSKTTVEVQNGNGFILASFLGNTGTTLNQSAYADLQKNAELNLTTLGNTGEAVNTGNNVMGMLKGSISLGDGAKINATTADGTTRGGVSLAANTSISIADSAEFNLAINGPMGSGLNAISIGANANFSVADEGKLNIILKNQGTSTNNIINSGSNSQFVIGQKGTFNIQLLDGTGTRNLINVGSNGTFRFQDAYSIDLDARANTSASLISMANPGRFIADVQKVSAWLKSPQSEEPFKTWNPIYGVNVTYNGTTTTNIVGQSVTPAITEDFLTNYRTNTTGGNPHSGFSRVLYEHIPDVVIGLDQPTDNPTETSSRVLSGVVNPDPEFMNGAGITFYLVQDENDPSTDVLLTETTTISPIEGDTRLFHTIADSTTGRFSFELPEDIILEADQRIKAVGWLNGKESSDSKIVLDTTPPKGEPRTVYTAVGELAPTPNQFIINPTDTNPVIPDFGYEFAEENPQASIEQMMTVAGEYDVYVYLLDNAVDATGAPAPNRTKILSKLIVYETLSSITGTDFEASYVDIRDLNDSELLEYILTKSKPEAYSIVDGVKTDISSLVTVSDFGGLNDIANIQPKEYTITLVVKAADSGLSEDITGTIKVTVVDVDAVLTVEFINEINQLLPGYTIKINGQVGDQIDLTKEEQVTKQLADLESAGYEIAERPENETAISINNTEVTVRYKLQGVLSLASAPSNLDFGSLTYNATTKRVDNPDVDQPLIVTDTRAETANGWTLTASLSTPMRNSEGQELINALRYVYKGEETILDTNAQTVFLNTEGSAGSFDISNSWGNQQGTDGVKLQIGSADTIHTGSYVGIITWKVMAGQP